MTARAVGALGLAVLFVVLALGLASEPDPAGPHVGFFNWDLLCEFYPHLLYSARAYRQGEIPLWNAEEFCGYPHLANGQTGVLYPPHLLFWLWPGLGGLIGLHLLHTLAAGTGAALLTRRLGGGPAGSALAFVVAAFGSQPAIGAFLITRNATLVWGPWLLLAVEWDGRGRRVGGVAAFMGFAFLAGYQPYAAYLALLVASYALGRAVQRRSWTVAIDTGLGLGLGTGLAAAVLLPLAELLTQSPRGDGISELMRYGDQLSAPDLTDLVVGSPSGVPWLFVGTCALLLAGWGGTVRGAGRVLAGIGALGFLFMLGRSTPVYVLLGELPPFASFRGVRAAFPLLHAPLAVLAGLGLQSWVGRGGARPRWRSGLAVSLGLLGLVAAGRIESPGGLALGAELVFVAVALWALPGRWLGFVVVVATFARLLLATASFPDYVHEFRPWFEPPAEERDALAGIHPVRIASHVGRLRSNTPGAMYLAMVGGSVPLVRAVAHPQSLLLTRISELYESLEPGLMRTWARPNAFRTLASPLVVTESRFTHERFPAVAAPGAQEFLARMDQRLYENPVALPRAYVASRVRVARDPEQARAMVRGSEDLERTAVVELPSGTVAGEMGAADAPSRARLIRLGINRLEVEVQAPNGGWLVLAETYYPGWRAEIDGRSRKIFPVSGAFRAVALPAGAHAVSMRYEPRSFRVGLFLSLLVLAGLIAMRYGSWYRTP